MELLLDILNKETDAYHAYLDLGMRKKHAYVNNEMDVFEAASFEEKGLTSKILALEAARVTCLKEEGFKSGVTIDELLDATSEEYKTELEQSASKLHDALIDCKKFQEENTTLMQHSSNYINHMIEVFSRERVKPAQLYSQEILRFTPTKIVDIT